MRSLFLSDVAIIFLVGSLTLAYLFARPAQASGETNDVALAMQTDTDGDGMSDWAEWQAGTNPYDPSNCIAITHCETKDGKLILNWQAVAASSYEIVFSPTISGLATNPDHIAFITSSGGEQPWFKTLCSFSNDINTATGFYRIRLVLPQDFDTSCFDMHTLE